METCGRFAVGDLDGTLSRRYRSDMAKMTTSKPHSFEKELRNLLDQLCVELGFCIRSQDVDQIANLEFLDADRFACEVLLTEGMSPEIEIKWRRQLRRRFTDRFGKESLS